MKRILTAVAAALLMASVSPAFAQASERVTAPVGGISIEKPAGWLAVAPDAALANLNALQFDSPEFQRLLAQSAAKPLIVFTQYPLTTPGLIPTIKVNYRHLPEVRRMGATGVLEGVIDALRQGFQNVEIIDAPEDVTVDGQPAGHTRVTYTMVKDGDQIPAVSELWIIPKGDYVLVVGSGYPPGEPSSRDAILKAVASVRIAP